MSLIRKIFDLFGQQEVSEQRRLPVDDMSTATVEPITDEPVTPQYYDTNGELQTDAGQLAGTVIVINLDNKNILNSLGDVVGMYGDTSITLGTDTALALTHLMPFRGQYAENIERNSFNTLQGGKLRAEAITDGFREGDYCIDHEHGVIYGVKATADVPDTVSYNVLVQVSGGSSVLPSSVNLAKVGGTAIALGPAAASASIPVVEAPNTTTGAAPATVSVGVASGTAIAANTSRKGLVLTNKMTNTGEIWLNLAAGAAVVGSGIGLFPGDSFVMDDRTFTTAQINAISTVAAQTLGVQELT